MNLGHYLGNIMLIRLQQQGSSTVGLLTATAIFIGLLVYADQFAFNKSENSLLSSFINNTPETVTTLPVESLSSIDTDTIQPSSQGIFETPTLTQENSNEVAYSTEAMQLDKQNSNVSTDAEMAVPLAQPQTITMPVNYMPGRWYGDQAAMSSYNTQNAGFNNNQQYYSTTRANGRGNGRGKMNGDGEFNFSMKFRARGRMDGNSDFDSNLGTYGNAYQQNLYNVHAVSNPAYRYSYFSY
jgi:hypothetical protein